MSIYTKNVICENLVTKDGLNFFENLVTKDELNFHLSLISNIIKRQNQPNLLEESITQSLTYQNYIAIDSKGYTYYLCFESSGNFALFCKENTTYYMISQGNFPYSLSPGVLIAMRIQTPSLIPTNILQTLGNSPLRNNFIGSNNTEGTNFCLYYNNNQFIIDTINSNHIPNLTFSSLNDNTPIMYNYSYRNSLYNSLWKSTSNDHLETLQIGYSLSLMSFYVIYNIYNSTDIISGISNFYNGTYNPINNTITLLGLLQTPFSINYNPINNTLSINGLQSFIRI
jgi:hypothetical protein